MSTSPPRVLCRSPSTTAGPPHRSSQGFSRLCPQKRSGSVAVLEEGWKATPGRQSKTLRTRNSLDPQASPSLVAAERDAPLGSGKRGPRETAAHIQHHLRQAEGGTPAHDRCHATHTIREPHTQCADHSTLCTEHVSHTLKRGHMFRGLPSFEKSRCALRNRRRWGPRVVWWAKGLRWHCRRAPSPPTSSTACSPQCRTGVHSCRCLKAAVGMGCNGMAVPPVGETRGLHSAPRSSLHPPCVPQKDTLLDHVGRGRGVHARGRCNRNGTQRNKGAQVQPKCISA